MNRYAFFTFCLLFTFVSLPWLATTWPFTLLTAVLSLVGINDLLQTRQALRRNYPILGNIRYLIETVRPEIRQYLLENDNDPLPFSRAQRSLVYARAKNEVADKAFGTLADVYGTGFEFIGIRSARRRTAIPRTTGCPSAGPSAGSRTALPSSTFPR